jgi:ABC-type transport system substrate-binding protein
MTMKLPPAAPVPTAPAPAVVRPRKSSNRLLDAALVVAAALAIGGVAFGIGRATAPASAASLPGGAIAIPGDNVVRPNASFDPGTGPGRGGLALAGGLTIDGTVTAIDGDTITVKLADGQEMTFTLDSSTAYHEATDATASDVAVGADVSVKVKGGPRVSSGADPSAAPRLSASDVTVTR